jgi:translocation and assembly module TamB
MSAGRRRLLKWLLVPLGLLLLALLVFWLVLTSDTGEQWLRRQVLLAVNDSVQGKLEAEQLHLGVGGQIVLENVKLYTPEGERVVEIARVVATPNYWALVGKRVVLRSARVESPRLYLKQDERGLNLSRAIEARVPSSDGESKLTLDVRSLQLEQGFVDYLQPAARYTLEQVRLSGAAMLALPKIALSGALHLEAKVTSPWVDALKLDLRAFTEKSGEVMLEAVASTSDSRIKGSLALNAFRIDLQDLLVSPRLVRAFAPDFKLRVPIEVKGSGSRTALDLLLTAGSARVTLKGNLHQGTLVDEAQLDAFGINLAELLEGGRPSQLSAHLKGRLNDARIGTLDGEVKGEASWNEDGKSIATAQVDATAVKGTVEIKALSAKLPGARVALKGEGSGEAIAVTGNAEATDLSAVARTVGELTGSAPPALSGSGAVAIIARGPLLHPWMSIDGSFKQLQIESLFLSQLQVDAQLADIRRPLEATGTLKAKRLQVGQTVLEDLRADVVTEGRHLQARLSTQGTQTLALSASADGTLDSDGGGVMLNALTIDYPNAHWQLEHPAGLGWRAGDFTVDAFGLTSRDQRLSVSGGIRAEQLEATAALENFDLRYVPPALLPQGLGLVGRVDASVHATGRLPKAAADFELGWHEGAVKGLQEIAVALHGHLDSEAAAGSFSASTAVGVAIGNFDLPLKKEKPARPMRLNVYADKLELGRAAAAFDAVLPVDGTVDLQLEVEGTFENPKPMLRAESANLRWCRGPCTAGEAENAEGALSFDRVTVSLSEDAEQHPVSQLAVTALGGLTQLNATVPMSLGRLIERVRAGTPISKIPLELQVQADALDLVAVSAAAQLQVPLEGKLTVQAKSSGTLAMPDLELRATANDFHAEALEPAQLTTTVKTNREESRVDLEVKRSDKTLLVSRARLGGPLETLWNEEQLTRTGLVADAELGPLQLADVWHPESGESPPPSGVLRAQVSAKGTLAAPRASMRGTLEKLNIGKVALGQANLAWDYENAKHVFGTAITSGGAFKARGELGLDVSLPAIRRGLEIAKAPLDATLSSDRFDLTFLSGIHPMLRTLGGVLKTDAQLKGPLGDPTLVGSVEWNQGRLGLAGFGEYRDLHLLLTGDAKGYQLRDLVASAGGGRVTFVGQAVRSRPGVFTLTAQSNLNKFPVITDDQLLAIATLDFQLQGEASTKLVEITKLTIPEAHIELPDVKRKNLQELDRPGDIVLVRNGVPLVKRKKRAAGPSAPGEPTRVRLLVQAPRNVWVKSSDVNLEVGLSDDFRVEYTDRPLMFGEISVLRGRLDVIGRHFEVQKDSQVRFGGPVDQPYLNVTAVHTNEREAVTVFVSVVGHGKDFALKTSSQPPLPDSEIFTLLTTGRRNLKLGGGSSISAGDAASVLGSLAASQLKTLVAKKLPLDVLSVESGKDGIQTAKVEAGTYLSDQVYLGYQLQLGADRSKAENVNALRIEYQISKSWSLEATAGDAPAGGAELVWGREY